MDKWRKQVGIQVQTERERERYAAGQEMGIEEIEANTLLPPVDQIYSGRRAA